MAEQADQTMTEETTSQADVTQETSTTTEDTTQQSDQDTQETTTDSASQSDQSTDSDTAAIPENAAGYQTPDADVPDFIKEFAHKQGYSQGQFSETMTFFGNMLTQQDVARKSALQQAGQEFITKTWGDNANVNIDIVKRTLKQADPDGALKNMLIESGYEHHPAVLGFIHSLGGMMLEGGYLKSETNRPQGNKSTAQTMYPSMQSGEM